MGTKSITSLVVAALLVLGSCSEGNVQFGGDRDENNNSILTVKGTFDDILPVTTRDIVIFIFTNLRDPGTFQEFDSGEVVVVKNGTIEFSMEQVESGDLTVVFLLDNPGTEADGQIDEGDPVAILDDPDKELEDTRSGLTIEIDDIDINFTDEDADGFPDPNLAEARDIRRVARS